MRNTRLVVSLSLFAVLFGALLATAQNSSTQGASSKVTPAKALASMVTFTQSRHKAPFHRDAAMLPEGAGKILLKNIAKAAALKSDSLAVKSSTGTNVKVNQDRNPWPKAEIAAAVDPTTGSNYVVMANDFRENFDHMFYHVSTDGGASWTDDSMVGGSDPVTGFIPLTFQSDPGVAIDSNGNSFVSTISGNLILDFFNGYINEDTEIYVAQGFNSGTYTSLLPTPLDDQPCDGTFTTFNCPAQLDKPLITIDNQPSSPNNGTIYVYYTLFCNGTGPNGDQPCTDGNATVPAFSSAILESHSPGAGQPFSIPSLVSGAFVQTQFSSLVVDNHGTAHIFFDDFSDPTGAVNMYMSTLSGGNWVVSPTPVAKFTFNGLNNLNWGFRDFGSVAPGCGIHNQTAYCAFSANMVQGGKTEGTPSVYVAVVNTHTGASKTHRVNNDTFGNFKDHFFAWATAKSDGSVYVGWYDNRHDPFSTRVEYFVGKSTDGGKTFPKQMAVSDTSFNPCTGFPGCGFFGDYTQLVSGPDGVVHAAWSDTRDSASMQIFSQSVTW